MIWICTLLLLFIAAWLFFNAKNEKQWVDAHSHDEIVASDEGLFAGLSRMVRTRGTSIDGKVSIDQENTRFARTVRSVREKTTQYGEKFFESRAKAMRIDDPKLRPKSVKDEDNFFGRAVARVSETVEKIDQKLEQNMHASSAKADDPIQPAGDDNLFARVTDKVAAKSDEISQKMAERTKRAATRLGQTRSAAEEGGLFGSVVQKVSGNIDSFDDTIKRRVKESADYDERRQSSGTNPTLQSEDWLSRTSAKIGAKVNELDDRLFNSAKNAAGYADTTTSQTTDKTN